MKVAFIAAFMLVLQSLAGAFAAGAGPQERHLDSFGNPLCITIIDTSDSDTDRDRLFPECCTVACSMFGAGIPAGAPGGAWFNPFASAQNSFSCQQSVVAAPDQARGPGSPRSPPSKV